MKQLVMKVTRYIENCKNVLVVRVNDILKIKATKVEVTTYSLTPVFVRAF